MFILGILPYTSVRRPLWTFGYQSRHCASDVRFSSGSFLIVSGFLVRFRRRNVLQDFATGDLAFRPISISIEIHNRFPDLSNLSVEIKLIFVRFNAGRVTHHVVVYHIVREMFKSRMTYPDILCCYAYTRVSAIHKHTFRLHLALCWCKWQWEFLKTSQCPLEKYYSYLRCINYSNLNTLN